MIGQGMHGFVGNKELVSEDIDKSLKRANRQTNLLISEAFRAGYTIDQIRELTKMNKWFLDKLMNIYQTSKELNKWGNNNKQIASLSSDLLMKAKETRIF